MSENPVEREPEWDLADRMRKALRQADVGVQEMADYMGVGRNTISTWINGRNRPGRPALRLWALRCGVPFAWLLGDTQEVTHSGRLVRKSAFPALTRAAA